MKVTHPNLGHCGELLDDDLVLPSVVDLVHGGDGDGRVFQVLQRELKLAIVD